MIAVSSLNANVHDVKFSDFTVTRKQFYFQKLLTNSISTW